MPEQRRDPKPARVLSGLRLRTPVLAVLVALALLTGFAYFFHFGATYQPDSATYIVPAGNLLTRHAFLSADGYPETERTPGYPLLILPFLYARLDLEYLVVFQHLLRVGVILAASAVALSLTRSYRQAVLTAVLLCIDLPLLDAANSVLSEMPFTVVLSLCLWLLWRDAGDAERPWPWSILYGLLCGAAVLIRPVVLFFFVPAAIYLFLARRRRRWQAVLIFLVAFALLPLLWAERNYRETGYFTVSSIGGYNMLFYRAAG
ncbi:MAG TPA: phospholipid carrier-dependent glycosyltransferase, partial [Terriglobia bacterium]|nr:phospholipid carrier-dependent glycosyltransferase [Terriglobia bacterium]